MGIEGGWTGEDLPWAEARRGRRERMKVVERIVVFFMSVDGLSYGVLEVLVGVGR